MTTSDQVFGSGPAPAHIAITPGQPITRSIRSIFVGTGGNMDVTDTEGTRLTYKNLANGSSVPVMAMKGSTPVAAGATAADLVGWV